MSSSLLAEFRQTWILRILTAITLFPLGSLFLVAIFLEGGNIWLYLITVVCFIVTILVWMNGFTKHIYVYRDVIVKDSFLGKKTVRIDGQTRYYYDYIRQNIQGIAVNQLFITIKHGSDVLSLDSNIKDFNILQGVCLQFEQRDQQQVIEQALKKRSILDFDGIQVSGAGISYKSKHVNFNELKICTVMEGYLRVRQHDHFHYFLKIPARKVPNLNTLLQILDFYMQKQVH